MAWCSYPKRYFLCITGLVPQSSHIDGVDIANSQPDAFAKTQPHAVSGKEKNLVAQPVGCGKQLVQLLDGQDIRDPESLWRFDQRNILPGFVEEKAEGVRHRK